LEQNSELYRGLFASSSDDFVRWKPAPEKWCLLEIVCHLYDEEREDFRTRVKHIFETPQKSLKPFDPVRWVTEREYMKQDFPEMVDKFLLERSNSIDWLQSLRSPPWNNAIIHQKMGRVTARNFLANWLAHDYLHFRQINRLRYQFLQTSAKEDLRYAGIWPEVTILP
jgi:hypothetical protein